MRYIRTAVRGVSVAASALVFFVMSLVTYAEIAAPDSYYNREGDVFDVSGFVGVPLTASFEEDGTVGAGTSAPLVREAELSLFGIIPVKTAAVKTVPSTDLAPCGTPFGVKILTDGVLVVGLNDILTETGSKSPAKEAGVRPGDIIIAIDGIPVSSNDEVASVITKTSGKPVSLRCKRDEREIVLELTPALSALDQNFKAGLWVRDSSAGIGTVSYYDPEISLFGGLGHAICDVDTGEILPILEGEVVEVTIHDVVKGTVGTPGELRGSFSSDKACGSIFLNNETGVFGKMTEPPDYDRLVPMGFKQEIRSGKATILTTVDGDTPKEYEIEIERINLLENSPTKNMVIRITDPELLKQTGGIVQGMSGSPILQNGKLVGAVTHVFVNDPTRGYGIFIENMLEAAG